MELLIGPECVLVRIPTLYHLVGRGRQKFDVWCQSDMLALIRRLPCEKCL